jgi:hypothetical protein
MLRGAEGDADKVGTYFGVFEAIRQNAKRERFRAGDRLIAGLAVGEDARKIGDLGDPPAVLVALGLNREMHA